MSCVPAAVAAGSGGHSDASLLCHASAGSHLLGEKGQDTGKAMDDLAFETHSSCKHPGGLL